jgi:hypothetical protein
MTDERSADEAGSAAYRDFHRSQHRLCLPGMKSFVASLTLFYHNGQAGQKADGGKKEKLPQRSFRRPFPCPRTDLGRACAAGRPSSITYMLSEQLQKPHQKIQ